MQVRVNSQKPLMVSLVGLITVAWLALWVWGASPYGRFLSHESLGELHLGSDLPLMTLFVAGWTLMTTAMMLPTTLPLIGLFHRFTAQRHDRLRLVLLLIAGYLGVWSLFGVLVHLADYVFHIVVEQIAWLESNHTAIGSATLVLAGLYQFSPLKYKCLDKCRSPMSFIVEHWRGHSEGRQALLLGVHHGLFCIGCCWALMLLMFAVGTGNVVWMLVLGGIMGIEKNATWGRRLSAPLGVFLLGLGLMFLWGSSLGIFGPHSHIH
jgi:predicted metal-binding membrane protein